MSKRIVPQCIVCGSDAPIMRGRSPFAANGGRTSLDLCYHHEAVCWDHLADPCDVCDRL